jgi:hypothetical protein
VPIGTSYEELTDRVVIKVLALVAELGAGDAILDRFIVVEVAAG